MFCSISVGTGGGSTAAAVVGGGGGGGREGGGGGSAGQRFFPPHHMQHLLEERQHFERVSPSRRTVYRKIVSGMQGSAHPAMTYLPAGMLCVLG